MGKFIYLMCLTCVWSVYKMSKRVQVTFTDEQWEILQRFKGRMGESDADIIRNIVIAWLSEKSIMSSLVKKEISEGEE